MFVNIILLMEHLKLIHACATKAGVVAATH